MATNLEKLKVAMKIWDAGKGEDIAPLLELVGDDFVMQSVAPAPLGAASRAAIGPEALRSYFTTLIDAWRMDYYRPEAFLTEDDDTIAVFATCQFTFRANGKAVKTPIATLWRFRDGKARSCVEVFDSLLAMRAVTTPV